MIGGSADRVDAGVRPGLLKNLPNPTLAAVVIAASLSLADIPGTMRLWQQRRVEFVLSIAAFLGVALLGVLQGIAVAVALSIFNVFRRAWWPYQTDLGRVPAMPGYHDRQLHPAAEELPGLVIFRFDAQLFFANARTFREQIRNLAAREPRPQWILIAAEPITDVDTTAADMLAELDQELNAAGTSLVFAELKEPVRAKLERYALIGPLDPEHFFPTLDAAVDAFRRMTALTGPRPWTRARKRLAVSHESASGVRATCSAHARRAQPRAALVGLLVLADDYPPPMTQVFLLALAAALNPTLVAASTLMMLLPNPKRLMLGYLLGALMTSITLGLVIVFSLEGSDAVSATENTLSPAATMTLGGIALAAAFVLRTGRHHAVVERRRARKRDKGPSRWQQALGRGSARATFVVGALLTLPGASYLAGLSRIDKLNYSTAETVLAGRHVQPDHARPARGPAAVLRDRPGLDAPRNRPSEDMDRATRPSIGGDGADVLGALLLTKGLIELLA